MTPINSFETSDEPDSNFTKAFSEKIPYLDFLKQQAEECDKIVADEKWEKTTFTDKESRAAITKQTDELKQLEIEKKFLNLQIKLADDKIALIGARIRRILSSH